MNQLLKKTGLLLLGALILFCPALYNGFPILHSDSGTYTRCAFTNIVEIDRPLMYSLFIKYTSLYYSLWLTVFAQALLLTVVLYILLKGIIKQEQKFGVYYLAIVTILSAFTGLGWYVAQIMPDILSAILIICITCLLFIENLSKLKQVTLGIIFIFCCATHFSHQLIAFVVSGLLVLILLYQRISKRALWLNIKKTTLIVLLSVSSYFTVFLINYTHGGGFTYSRSSHAFLMAHFIESGIVKEFLIENCDKPEFKICKTCLYKDSLENEIDYFLWDYNSSFYKVGGWEHSADEYNFIISKMLSSPKYLFKNIVYSCKCGLKQLVRNDIGEGLFACGEFTAAGIEIKKHFPKELATYLKSKQNTEEIFKTFNLIGLFQYILLCISVLYLIYCFFDRSAENKLLKYVSLAITAMVIVNSFITAGLSTVHDRFQARVSWLLILLPIVFIINNRQIIIAYFKKGK